MDDKNSSYLVRHWRGELPLGVSYWGNGALVSLIAVFLLRSLTNTGAGRLAPSLAWLLVVPLAIWQFVGIWRSAARANREGGPKVWTYAAQVVVFLASLVLGMNAVLGARTAVREIQALAARSDSGSAVREPLKVENAQGKLAANKADRAAPRFDLANLTGGWFERIREEHRAKASGPLARTGVAGQWEWLGFRLGMTSLDAWSRLTELCGGPGLVELAAPADPHVRAARTLRGGSWSPPFMGGDPVLPDTKQIRCKHSSQVAVAGAPVEILIESYQGHVAAIRFMNTDPNRWQWGASVRAALVEQFGTPVVSKVPPGHAALVATGSGTPAWATTKVIPPAVKAKILSYYSFRPEKVAAWRTDGSMSVLFVVYEGWRATSVDVGYVWFIDNALVKEQMAAFNEVLPKQFQLSELSN